MHVIFLENKSKLSDHLNRVLSSDSLSCFNIYNYDMWDSYLKVQGYPEPDLIVLDQDFEVQSVTKYLPLIKKQWKEVKVLVLAEKPGAKERVRILELGADDCMTKPIDVEELLLRIKLLYQRNLNNSKKTNEKQFNIIINDNIKDVEVSGSFLKLNHKEYLLAETFLSHPNKVFSRVILLDLAWDIQSEVNSNVVEVTVSSLRRKMEKAGANARINSRRHLGYWLE